MSEIGIERFAAGHGEKDQAERDQRNGPVREQELDRVIGVDRRQHPRIVENVQGAEHRDRHEPDHGDRSEKCGDAGGAVALHREQRNQDHDRDRDHVMFERRRGELQTFDRRQHRDRGRDEGITQEHRRPDHAEHEDEIGAPAERAHRERCERQRTALAVVVGAQQDQDVFRGHHQEQRPQDHRQHAEHDVARQRSAVLRGMHGLAEGIERARADIAEHDADRAQRQRHDIGAAPRSLIAVRGRADGQDFTDRFFH